MRQIDADKLKSLFSPALTGKTTYSADEILLSIETMPDSELTSQQVMEYCKARNYALVDNEFLHIILGDNPMELFGLPIEDVKRVIKIYKVKGVVPTTEYKEGFEDGVNYMKAYYERVMDELIKNITR